MTTKRKIILGFVLVILVLAAVAALGYRSLQGASDNFVAFSRQAHVNIDVSDMSTSLTRAIQRVYNFIRTKEPGLMDRALGDIDAFAATSAKARSTTHIASRAAALTELEKQIGGIKKEMQDIRTSITERDKFFAETLKKSYEQVDDILTEMSGTAIKVQNTDMLYTITLIRRDLAACQTSLTRYAHSGAKEDGESARGAVQLMGPNLKRMGGQIISEVNRLAYARLMEAYEVMLKGLDQMDRLSAEVVNSTDTMRQSGLAMMVEIDKFNDQIDSEMNTFEENALAANSSAQSFTLGISVGGVVIGVILALLIIVGIIKMLNALASFAGAIARGELSANVNIREKGEVGQMVEAMRQIPATLNAIITAYKQLESNIESGYLDATADAAQFKGDFATLVKDTNGILQRFLMVIESLPSPVVMLNKDLKAAYINTVARSLAGSDYKGKTCPQLFARDDFGTAACAMRRAVDTKQSASAETRAHPQGRNMDVSYTAIPMLDARGNLAAVLQLITDLTAIKSQQRVILDVAAQASEISNRVAAASEELSAQVEQVSRGAEMQRARVESTASAMTQMNSTVLEVARSAGQASEQSENTRNKAEQGAGLVNNVVQSINTVNTVALTLQENMQELGEQAESIGGVMNVISDVADQTNLLALNAAIEAARAGEAGRGFAVVADEVRKLAERTMSATQEVGTSIRAIQQSARNNISEVGHAVKNIEEATSLANKSGLALKEIVDLAAANSSVVASIATAAEEQSATSEEINHAIEEINTVVGETTEGMLQSSHAVQELSSMAQELRRVMEGLRNK